MSTSELWQKIEALPKPEQVLLLERLSALTSSEIPESFLQGMAEAERGELLDLDESLKELDGP